MFSSSTTILEDSPTPAEALWNMLKSGSEAAREKIAAHYMPLVRRIARKAARRIPRKVDLDDIISAGYVGLLKAMEAFDPRRGVRFNTFCTYRVRGAIFDEVRAMDWVPRGVRQREKQIAKTVRDLTGELSEKPGDREVAAGLGLSEKEFGKIAADARPVSCVSLDAPRQNPSGPWAETIGDGRQRSPLTRLFCGEVKQIVEQLNPTEQLVITRYYYEGRTMKQVGLELNLTESRVSQIHASLLGKLRAWLGEATATPIAAGRPTTRESRPAPVSRAA